MRLQLAASGDDYTYHSSIIVKKYIYLVALLAKYLVYPLTLIISFVSRSVATLLNISRETGLAVPSTQHIREVDLGFEGLLDGLPASSVCGCALDLGSGIWDVCMSIIIVVGEIGAVGRVSLSTAF